MADGEIVSILFTDLVGSTSLADRLGDAGAEDSWPSSASVLDAGGVCAAGGECVAELFATLLDS